MSKASGIKAVLISGGDRMDGDRMEQLHKIPGAFYYYTEQDKKDDVSGMLHSCPCGCGKIGSLSLVIGNSGSPRWKNSGTYEEPSLTPSVGIRPWDGDDVEADGFHWHGWLRDGVWISV